MRRQRTVLFLPAAAVTVLASLYLPWQKAHGEDQSGVVITVLALFAHDGGIDGWTPGVGEVAALSALLIAVLAGAALFRPDLTGRLPFGFAAALVGYFTTAVAVETHVVGRRQEVVMEAAVDFRFAYGAYLGLAAALVVLAAAAWLRRDELGLLRFAPATVVVLVVSALLVTFLLPWQRLAVAADLTVHGIGTPAGVVAAALALCVPFFWWETKPGARLALAAGVVLFTAAAASSFASSGSYAYGTWLGLGIAAALLALALKEGGVPRPARRPWYAIATGVAAAFFVVALFLPWQKACYATAITFGSLSGRCISANGWASLAGTAAALLAIGLVVLTLTGRRLPLSPPEFAAAIILLVITLAAGLVEGSGSGQRFERSYGSAIGAVSAACLFGLVATRMRLPRPSWVALVPLTACAAYLAVVFVPWWDVLPRGVESELRFAPFSWLTVTGALIAIHLFRSWVLPSGRRLLVVLPAALFVLAALDLLRLRDGGITWGGWIVAGLCLWLVLLGRIEQREGLENLRVPQLLRVDRL